MSDDDGDVERKQSECVVVDRKEMADQLVRLAAAAAAAATGSLPPAAPGVSSSSSSSNSTAPTSTAPPPPPPAPRPPTPVHIIESGDLVTRGPDEPPAPDPNGDAQCHICQEQFRDNLVLKEHFEKVHPKEMYHCTIAGCDKIFSTRKSRNRHSQNDNLHKHLPPSSVAQASFSLTAAAAIGGPPDRVGGGGAGGGGSGGGGGAVAAAAAALKMSGLHSLNHHHLLNHHLHEIDGPAMAPLHVD